MRGCAGELGPLSSCAQEIWAPRVHSCRTGHQQDLSRSALPQRRCRSSGVVGRGTPDATIPVGIANGFLSTWVGQLVQFNGSSHLPASPGETNSVWKKLEMDLPRWSKTLMLKTKRHFQAKGSMSSQTQGACKHKSCKSSRLMMGMLLALLHTSTLRGLHDEQNGSPSVTQPCTPTAERLEHHAPHIIFITGHGDS